MQKSANHDSDSGEFSSGGSLLDDPALLEQAGEHSEGDDESAEDSRAILPKETSETRQ